MKTRHFFLTFIFVVFPFLASSQIIHQKTYGDFEYKSIADLCASSNDELITAGYWSPSIMITPFQPFLTRLDAIGDVVWAKEYASTGIGRAVSVTPTSDGGFLATGQVDTIPGIGGSKDGYVMKIDGNGNVQWMTIVGASEDEEFTRVYEAPNGEIIAIGVFTVQATSDEYFWFVKMSSTGTVINSFIYFPEAQAEARALAFHPDGGYVIGGIGRVNFINEAILFKISSTGVLEWYRSYGTFSGSEVIEDLVLLNDNSVVFTGTRYQSDYDLFLGKTDSIGQLLWHKDFGGVDHDEAHRVLEHPNGGFVVSGLTENLDGEMGPMLFKTDVNGNLEWAKVYGNGLAAGTMGLTKLSNDYFALGGTILPNQGSSIGVVSQVNSNGEGCDYTTVTLPQLMTMISVDTPVVYASGGPSLSVSYNPIVSDLVIPDSTICSTLSISEYEASHQFDLYPNPVGNGTGSNEFWIATTKFNNEKIEVEVFDFMGRSVFSDRATQSSYSVSIDDWSSGIYMVSIRVGQYIEMKRVVVR